MAASGSDTDSTYSTETETETEMETSDDDLEDGEPHVFIDTILVKRILEENKSRQSSEIMDYCTEEKKIVEHVMDTIIDRMAAIGKNKSTPRVFAEASTDTWSHLLEILADHVRNIYHEVRRA